MMHIFEPFVSELFDRHKGVPVSDIPFDNEVRKLCEQNMCGCYGKSWTCPPAIGAVEELQSRLSAYTHSLIFYKVYPLEDSFDWEGMMTSVKNFQTKTFKLKKKIQEQTAAPDFLLLGAGACQLCDSCTYPEQEPCRHPDDALFSVESYGIDAMKMMMENGLKYNNGPNTVTYIGILFYP
jgi:predicted metal-binding protein